MQLKVNTSHSMQGDLKSVLDVCCPDKAIWDSETRHAAAESPDSCSIRCAVNLLNTLIATTIFIPYLYLINGVQGNQGFRLLVASSTTQTKFSLCFTTQACSSLVKAQHSLCIQAIAFQVYLRLAEHFPWKLLFRWNPWFCEKGKCETWIQALNRRLPFRETFRLAELWKNSSVAMHNFVNLEAFI